MRRQRRSGRGRQNGDDRNFTQLDAGLHGAGCPATVVPQKVMKRREIKECGVVRSDILQKIPDRDTRCRPCGIM